LKMMMNSLMENKFLERTQQLLLVSLSTQVLQVAQLLTNNNNKRRR
jgi:hypothetical protein